MATGYFKTCRLGSIYASPNTQTHRCPLLIVLIVASTGIMKLMAVLLIVIFSTLAHEAAVSIGKKSLASKAESLYAFGFLGFFWVAIFMLAGVVFFDIDFYLSAASLPTLLTRIVIECLLVYISAKAISVADRSTAGFLHMITIPLLLLVDIFLGYGITLLQVAGIALLFIGIGALFLRSKKSMRGAKYLIAMSLIAVVTTSLYKYNITNFNSVAAEQLVVVTCIMLFFSLLAKLHGKRQPVRLLFKPATGFQSLAAGFGFAVESFAFLIAPPSIVIAFKRGFALLWSIVFGHKWFHEHKLALKLRAATLALGGLVLISIAT